MIVVSYSSVEELPVKEIAKVAIMCAHEAARVVHPMPISNAPYRCQIAALNFACGLRSILYCGGKGGGGTPLMEMQIGKSLTSIVITGAFAYTGYIRCVMVVIPLSILGAREEEF